jgi:hypothetical protein
MGYRPKDDQIQDFLVDYMETPRAATQVNWIGIEEKAPCLT